MRANPPDPPSRHFWQKSDRRGVARFGLSRGLRLGYSIGMKRVQPAGLWRGAIGGISVVVAHDAIRHFFQLQSQRAIALSIFMVALGVFGLYYSGGLINRPLRTLSILVGAALIGAAMGYAW